MLTIVERLTISQYNFEVDTEKAQINLPVYLDADNLEFVEKVAKKKRMDLNSAVNEILRGDKELAKVLG